MGKEVFWQTASEGKRRLLYPAKVISTVDEQYEFEMEELSVEVAADAELLVYYHKDRDFLKAPAIVVGDVQTGEDEKIVFTIKITGAAVSADERECYRASTVVSGYEVGFGEDGGCALMDISATGFAVKTPQLFKIANTIPAALIYEDTVYTGKVCVQSVRELRKGQMRYGVSCLDKKPSGNNLLAGVQKFSLFVQREQARRLAGAS